MQPINLRLCVAFLAMAASLCGQNTFSGMVTDSNGAPAVNVRVTAKSADATKPEEKSVTTDVQGNFTFPALNGGKYDIRLDYPAVNASASEGEVEIKGAVTKNFEVPQRVPEAARARPQVGWTLFCVSVYFLSVVMVRWHNIAKSVHELIQAQLRALHTRLHTELDCGPGHLEVLQETVTNLNTEVTNWRTTKLFWEFFFWSRGRENAAWVAIHEIERQLASYLAPPEQVRSYLLWAESELRVINKASAIVIADEIHTLLLNAQPADSTAKTAQEKASKAMLGRAIGIIYGERDLAFSTLMEWQNKSSWLIIAALVMIVFLVGAAGHAVLFLAGAAGGYSSRVMRALKREDVPLDYGASWTTLFLSPLFGALSGWSNGSSTRNPDQTV